MINRAELFKEVERCENLLNSMETMVLPLRDLKAHKDEKEIDEINQKAPFPNLDESERNMLAAAWAKWRNTTDSEVLKNILEENENPALELHAFLRAVFAQSLYFRKHMEFMTKTSVRNKLLETLAATIKAENENAFPLSLFDGINKHVKILNNYFSILQEFLKAFNENRIELNSNLPGNPKALVIKLDSFFKTQISEYSRLLETLKSWKDFGSLTDDKVRVNVSNLLIAFYKDKPENSKDALNQNLNKPF